MHGGRKGKALASLVFCKALMSAKKALQLSQCHAFLDMQELYLPFLRHWAEDYWDK